MNKAVTEGIAFNPPAFSEGLDVWSSGDGTLGSDTYAGSGNGAFVPSDSHFDGCLEVWAFGGTAQVKHMGLTPILPGCYLRVTARIKAMSGPLPSVAIAGTGGASAYTPVLNYGEVVEVSAIIGTGYRRGVDLVWADLDEAHIGVNIIADAGAVIRVDDITIEDVSNIFVRDMMGLVDVRDYGARGDGVTDDSAAFEAADADANGREVLVSAGVYYLGQDVTIENQIHFEGRVTMPGNRKLILQKNFDFATYADAFRDEEMALRKAIQALMNFSDHSDLDLNGFRIALTKPLDVQAVEATKTTFETRRVIRNGQIEAISGPEWEEDRIVARASYSPDNALKLTNVQNVGAIPVGSLIEGSGVGREIYVRSVNVSAQQITLSKPLYDAEGTQNFTFTRFKYMLDFSGFQKFSQLTLQNIHFQGAGVASGIMLAPDGQNFTIRDCHFSRAADRCVTSIGRGCQDLSIDRCQFFSNEMNLPVLSRKTICFNANANDVKIRDNRVVRFKHFCILAGTGTVITGNHWFHGDSVSDGVRLGGIVIANTNPKTMITGNYIDNNFIEWTNEYEAEPDAANQYSFGGLTITGNICTANDVAPWFRWIMIKPYGPGHFIHGLTVTGNVFRTLNGAIDRIEGVNTSLSDLDRTRMRNVVFDNNVFHGISTETRNPCPVRHDQQSAQKDWIVPTNGRLPFDGWARVLEYVTKDGSVTNSSGAENFSAPGSGFYQGSSKSAIKLIWPEPVKGKVRCSIRMDNPE